MRVGSRIGIVVVLGLGLGLGALALPLSAGAVGAGAKPVTRVFSVSFDGNGKFDYNARGANGDAGCYMNVSDSATYSFDNLWTVTAQFTSLGKGKYKTKVTSIKHVDGPQAFGKHGTSHLTGKQTHLPDNECQDITITDDTGKFDCTSSTVTLTAFPNPAMKVDPSATQLSFEGRAFLDGHWKYTGTDSIPSDKKGCATYEDDMTYGSDLVPGIYDTSKVGLTIKQLINLKKGKKIAVDVALGKNTEFPRLNTCDAAFGAPRVCVIHSQSLSAKFAVIRVK
jgi:hypothetical protein